MQKVIHTNYYESAARQQGRIANERLLAAAASRAVPAKSRGNVWFVLAVVSAAVAIGTLLGFAL
jgi:hypothetical protein